MKIVLVAPCILHPFLQAVLPADESHWGTPFTELLHASDVKIIPLACTETEFCGNHRKKHGIHYYSSLAGYAEFCSQKAAETFVDIQNSTMQGEKTLICLGIEHSPSCAVSYMYSKEGTLKRKGIYFEALAELMSNHGIECIMIGINRKYPRKAYNALMNHLCSTP